MREKTDGHDTYIIFLGIEVDSAAGECRLSKDKVSTFIDSIDDCLRHKKAAMQQFQTLVGQLNLALRIIYGRLFLKILSQGIVSC